MSIKPVPYDYSLHYQLRLDPSWCQLRFIHLPWLIFKLRAISSFPTLISLWRMRCTTVLCTKFAYTPFVIFGLDETSNYQFICQKNKEIDPCNGRDHARSVWNARESAFSPRDSNILRVACNRASVDISLY